MRGQENQEVYSLDQDCGSGESYSAGQACEALSGPGIALGGGTEKTMVQGRAESRRAKAEFTRQVLRLAWPVVAEQLMQTLTQMIDMIMVGRLGASAVAAVGLANQPLNIAQGVFMGLGVGATALVARFMGAGDRKSAEDVAAQSITIAAILSTIVAIVAFWLADGIVVFMGAEPDVVGLGTSYLRYVIPGLAVLMVNVAMGAAVRGAGDTRTPMVANMIINVVNTFGNWLLIYGNMGFPAMGVDGAALATTLSRIAGTAFLFVAMLTGKTPIRLVPSKLLRFHTGLITRIVNIGLPAAGERVLLSSALTFYVKIVATLGTVAYAAHSISINVESLSYMPGFGFAVAATTMVGQNLGAKRPDLAEKYGWEALRIGVWTAAIGGVVLFLFPAALMRLYVDDPQIIHYGTITLRIMAFGQVPMIAGWVMAGALRGAGDTKAMLYLTGFCVWGIRLVSAYVFVNYLDLGLFGAWLAMLFDQTVRGVVATLRFKSGRWKEIAV